MRGCAWPAGDWAAYPRCDPGPAGLRLPADTRAQAALPVGVRLEFTGDAEAVEIDYHTATAELGFRVNQSLYVNAFFDAGNVWRRAREIDPTRLFRGSGLGVSTVTPLGPLGIDLAYGFDRVDVFGRPKPAWKTHFRLGQLF